jgi:hypothetical protein
MTQHIPGVPNEVNASHNGGETFFVPAETLATFPSGTFLENIVISASGDIFLTSFLDGTIIHRTPDGTQNMFAHIDGTVSGIVTTPDGGFFVCNQQPHGPESIWYIDAHGRTEKWLELPDARFLNGMARLSDQLLLAADSFTATVWQIDITQHQAAPWLTHEALSKHSSQNTTPGPNGIKVFDDAVFVSNSERTTVIRIPVLQQQQAGQPVLYADHLLLDDFAFDTYGNLYGATHPLNTVVRLAPTGTRLTIAGPEQGVGGCTATAFGTNQGKLYVVTDGGVLAKKPEPARLVSLDISKLNV